MRKSGCNERKLYVRARPRNGDISLYQRCLKMGASTADCIWQITESIPELLNHHWNRGVGPVSEMPGPISRDMIDDAAEDPGANSIPRLLQAVCAHDVRYCSQG